MPFLKPLSPTVLVALCLALPLPALAFGPPFPAACMEETDEDTRLARCMQIATMAGNPEDARALAAIEAAKILTARAAYDDAADLLLDRSTSRDVTALLQIASGDVEFARGDYGMAGLYYEFALITLGDDAPDELREKQAEADRRGMAGE